MMKFCGFFKRLADFVDRHPDYSIWVCASMGQAATKARKVETQLIIKDLAQFLKAFGLNEDDWQRCPSMIPQYNIRLKEEKLRIYWRASKSSILPGKLSEPRKARRVFRQ
jgi:hypothetical protein